MPGLHKERRKRVVQFLLQHRELREDWKQFTVKHFVDERVPQATVYRVISRYEVTKSFKRLQGSGRRATIMTPHNCRRLKRMIDQKCGLSQRALAIKFKCSRTLIRKCLKPNLIPFRRSHYPRGGYILRPGKASSHYARVTLEFLGDEGVHFVAKEDNHTEVPQCRPNTQRGLFQAVSKPCVCWKLDCKRHQSSQTTNP